MKKFVTLLLFVPLFISCSSDDDNINLQSSDATLAYGEEFQINAKSDTKITYGTENVFHASVNENGVVKGGRVGETNIVLTNGSDTKRLKVTIAPKSNLYPEPNIEFGISRSDLINKLGTPSDETSDGIVYDNYSVNAPYAIYTFDSNNKLETSGVLVNLSQSSNLNIFLDERYAILRLNNGATFYMNALSQEKASIVVGATQYNTSYKMVGYFANSASTPKSLSDQTNDLLLEKIDKLLKK